MKKKFARKTFLGGTLFALALLTAVLSACGGGGGSASEPAAVDPGGVKTGGTGAYAAGPISGLGSIIVGGIEFDDRSATVLDDDGNSIDRTQLRIGVTVAVDGGTLIEGTTSNPSASSVAKTIDVRSEIVGRVSAVDAAAGTLTVLGQTVRVNAATGLDAIIGGRLTALQNQVVEVYALPGVASGSLLATRVSKTTAGAFKLRGLVGSVDATTQTLRIGSATLSYAGVPNVPAPLAGAEVRVRVAAVQATGGVWPITGFGTAVRTPADGRDARLEGVAAAYASASASFRVNGVNVDARGAALPATLATGVRVEVRGRMNGSTLVATEVQVKTEDESEREEFEVKGSIDSVDTPAKTFVVKGQPINWSTARFSNGASAQLRQGAEVEVHGVWAADRSTVMATEIEFKGQ